MDFIEKTKKIVSKYAGAKDSIMAILQDIQEDFGYVPRDAVKCVSEICGINESRLFGVITFYSQFYLRPRGKNIIRVCCGTACHVRGAARNLAKIEELLHIKAGETTPDKKYTLEKIACMGACGLAPVITVNKDVYGHVTPDMIDKILNNK
ncbi:MAG: NADH-quinone oxidoreductase subunit NuoE [Candidatus Omnitrophota bacterium]